MGADNIPPGERLEQGAKVGKPTELAPGWKPAEGGGVEYDPTERKGGATESDGKSEPVSTGK